MQWSIPHLVTVFENFLAITKEENRNFVTPHQMKHVSKKIVALFESV